MKWHSSTLIQSVFLSNFLVCERCPKIYYDLLFDSSILLVDFLVLIVMTLRLHVKLVPYKWRFYPISSLNWLFRRRKTEEIEETNTLRISFLNFFKSVYYIFDSDYFIVIFYRILNSGFIKRLTLIKHL